MDCRELKYELINRTFNTSILIGLILSFSLNGKYLPMLWGAASFNWADFVKMLIPFAVPFAVGLTYRNNVLPLYVALLNLKNPFFLLDGNGKVRLVSNRLVAELNEISDWNSEMASGKAYEYCNVVGMSFESLMTRFGFAGAEQKEVLCRFRNHGEIALPHQVLGRKISGRRYGFICVPNRDLPNGSDLPVQGMFIRKDDLSKKDQAAVMILAKAAESKDKDTGAHILRMWDNCMMLGSELALSEDEMEVLDYGSILHDVGKIAIADHILNKPAKLNAEEWDIMKTHAAKGKEILLGGGDPLLDKVAVIPEQHHENYDGSGYPAGLKGDEISLLARIVSVVDTFDALSSKRPYKEKFPAEKIYDEMEKLKGRKFDPHVLDAFYNCLKNTRPEWRELILARQNGEELHNKKEIGGSYWGNASVSPARTP